MPSIASSAISWIEYDPVNRILEITFRTGRTYTLRGVPVHHYAGLLHAASAGRYFNAWLRGRY